MSIRPPTTARAKARLAAEIIAVAARAKRALRGDIRSAVRALRDEVLTGDGAVMPVRDAAGFGYAVQRTLTVARARCLVQSLVLTAILARRGQHSTLVIGVRPGDDFGAHAWVEVNGHPVLPGGAGGFSRLVEL